MDGRNIEPYTTEDRQRLLAGIRNAVLPSLFLWGLIIWAVSSLF